MDTNRANIAVSALYTAATWQWAGLPGAALVTPPDAQSVFRVVNGYMRFYQWLNPRTHSLRHQLLHRHAAIDRLIADSGVTRVVEVASGLSPRGITFSADPALTYTEIDLPDMVAFKRRQLSGSEAGRAVLARDNLVLRAGDVTTLDFATEFAGPPLAVVTEGLMMYFPRRAQQQIWTRIAALLAASGGLYIFDYIPLSEEPPRSLPGRLLHFLRVTVLRLKGDFAYDQRDRQAVADDLRQCGFADVQCLSTADVAPAWGLPDSHVASNTLIYCCRPAQPGPEAA